MTLVGSSNSSFKGERAFKAGVVLLATALACGVGAASLQKSASQDLAAAVERTSQFTTVSAALYEEVQREVAERSYSSKSEVSGIIRPAGGELMLLSPVGAGTGTSEENSDGVPMVVTTLPIGKSTEATYEEATLQGTAEEFTVSYSYTGKTQSLWPFTEEVTLTQEIVMNAQKASKEQAKLPQVQEVL
jgi:hypothetical protein